MRDSWPQKFRIWRDANPTGWVFSPYEAITPTRLACLRTGSLSDVDFRRLSGHLQQMI